MGEKLYLAAVSAARRPVLYTEFEVPDTVDGRFDAIVLHLWLVLLWLRGDAVAEALKTGADEVGQDLFDTMVTDMDRSLREMGVSDVRVGKRVKDMAKGFYGRLKAYDEGLSGPETALEEALRRNLFGTVDVQDGTLVSLAEYLKSEVKSMASLPDDEVLAGRMEFGEIFPPVSR